MENLTHSLLTQMKDDYTTNYYLIYTFLLKKVGRMYFWNLGVKGLIIILQIQYSWQALQKFWKSAAIDCLLIH